jgi:hypothetical protein
MSAPLVPRGGVAAERHTRHFPLPLLRPTCPNVKLCRHFNEEVLREVHDASYRTIDQLRLAVCDPETLSTKSLVI